LKKQSFNSPTIDSEKEKKTIPQLLRFNPDVVSTILALSVWAGIIGLTASLIIVGLFLGQAAFADEWEPALTHPSSILIGEKSSYIRLIPEKEACQISSFSDGNERLLCDFPFEGSSIALNVELEDGTSWRATCSAGYDSKAFPCDASFAIPDNKTYIIVQTKLGLSEERFQQLVTDTANIGWSEKDSIWLARGLVTFMSLCVLGLLWRHSGRYTNEHSSAAILRVVYAAGISLMIFASANFVSFAALLAFNLID